NWEATGDGRWKQTLIGYNQEDCSALRKVTDFVRAAAQEGAVPQNGEGPPVVRVQDLKDDLPPGRSWGTVQFVHPDFEHVNGCAYFDYQRERVYVRSSEAIRRSRRRCCESRTRKLRCNREVELTASTCPRCQGGPVAGGVPRQEASCAAPRLKRAFDLVLTPSGLRRSIVHCRTSVHRCQSCGVTFVP